MLPRCPLLFLLKHREKVDVCAFFCVRKEGNGNVLLEQKRQWQLNTTKEEDDNKLPSFFSLQQHYRKRR